MRKGAFTCLLIVFAARAEDHKIDKENIVTKPTAEVPPDDDNPCDDIASNWCAKPAIKELKKQADDLNYKVTEVLQHAFTQLMGGDDIKAFTQKAVEKEGYHLSPSLKEDAKDQLLLPYNFTGKRSQIGHVTLSSWQASTFFDDPLLKCNESDFPAEPEKKAELAQAYLDSIRKITSKHRPRSSYLQEVFTDFLKKDDEDEDALNAAIMDNKQARRILATYDDWDQGEKAKTQFTDALVIFFKTQYANSRANAPGMMEDYSKRYALQKKLTHLCDFFSAAKNVQVDLPVALSPAECDGTGNEVFAHTSYSTPLPTAKLEEKITNAQLKFEQALIALPHASIAKIVHQNRMLLGTEAESRGIFKQEEDEANAMSLFGSEKEWDGLSAGTKQSKAQSIAAQGFRPAAAKDFAEELGRQNLYKDLQEVESTDFMRSNATLKFLCDQNQGLVMSHVADIVTKAGSNVSMSRPVVEGITNLLYSDEHNAQSAAVFQEARKDVEAVFQQKIFPMLTPQQKTKALAAFHEMILYRPKAISKVKFKKDPDVPYETLDIDSVDITDLHYPSFQDPELKDFTEMNAFYEPELSYGEQKMQRLFHLYPALVDVFAQYHGGLAAVVYHELGHHMGPVISRVNGYDVGDLYKPLYDCYARPQSIRMTSDQKDEIFADWISAEATANKLKATPDPEARKKIAEEAIGPFCLFMMQSPITNYEDKDPHPVNRRRLNGIFGAQPEIRKALGCPEKGPYPYCSFQKGAK